MKGLLLKDIGLLKNMKVMIAIYFILGAIFSFTNTQFILGTCYVATFSGMLGIGTLSYDEYDNGNAYLLTLPITRKEYVLEKYILTFSCILGGVCCITLWVCIVSMIRQYSFENVLTEFVVAVMITTLISAVILPVQLKYGAEKSKLALLIIAILVGICSAMILKNIDVTTWHLLQYLTPLKINLIAVIIGCICVLISFAISVKIMEKKEY